MRRDVDGHELLGRSDAEGYLDFTDGDVDGLDSSITCLVCHSIMSVD